jgi:putative ABC transport system permease protein
MLSELLRLAWSNMRRARLRLLMTAAGVVVGTTAVILLIALTIGLQGIAESSLGSNVILTEITVYPSSQSTFDDDRPLLNDAALEHFQALAGIKAVVPLLSLVGRSEFKAGEFSNYAEVYGISANSLAEMNFQVESGTLSLEAGQAIFGGSVPRYFLDPKSDTFEPQVVDLYETTIELHLLRFDGQEQVQPLITAAVLLPETGQFDHAVFIPMEAVIEQMEWIQDDFDPDNFEYTRVLIRTNSREITNPLRNSIRKMGYETDTVGDFLDELNSFFITMRLVLGATGGIALLVAAFVVANTMMMSVLERTREIGLMKAIGARDRDVLLLFLFEAGLVGLIGGIVGVAVAFLLGNRINDAILNSQIEGSSQLGFLPINMTMIEGGELIIIPSNLALLAIVIATGVGLLSGLLPAWRAARMSPVDALKG